MMPLGTFASTILHDFALAVADEGLADRGGRGEQALGEVRLGLAHDLELHLHLRVHILDRHLGKELDGVRGKLGLVNHTGVRHFLLEPRNLNLQETLRITRGVVFRILGEVALLPRLRDGRGDHRTLGQCVGQVLLELVVTRLGHVLNCHSLSFLFLFVSVPLKSSRRPKSRSSPSCKCKDSNYFCSRQQSRSFSNWSFSASSDGKCTSSRSLRRKVMRSGRP